MTHVKPRAQSPAVRLLAHQEEGVEFLLNRHSGLLAFEQGLGKTLVAIEAFCRLLATRRADQMLVVCPNSLKRNWVHEINKFAPHLTITLIEGDPATRRRLLSDANTAVILVSYETARSEVSGILALLSRKTTVLVLDESHFVKNHRSLTGIAAQHFSPRAAYRWLLSGTPVTNSVADLFNQINIVAGSPVLGSFAAFTAVYGEPGASEALRARVEPYVLRRTKDECLDLPEKIFYDIRVELPDWQRKLYVSMRDTLACEIESLTGEEFRAYAPTALSKILRLSQLASNPRLLLPICDHVPAKVLELDELLREICTYSGEKVILWSNYVQTIEMLRDRYQELGAAALYGEVSLTERSEIARRFQTDRHFLLLIANPAAAGTGFTLTAARYAIYETLNWRYDHYAQSQDRNHRIGQTKPVTYIRLIAADTIEEAIASALDRKSALARALLGDPSIPPETVSLTREQLCALLMDNKWPDDPDDRSANASSA